MILTFYHQSEFWLNKLRLLHPAASLAARLYIAKVFLTAGLLKIKDWETTLFLFEEEYQVPVLSPLVAAYLGTFGELLFPILLIAGFATRFAAIGLFIVNWVAVIALPDMPTAALYLHIIWALLIARCAIYGAGFISLDRWLTHRRFNHQQ